MKDVLLALLELPLEESGATQPLHLPVEAGGRLTNLFQEAHPGATWLAVDCSDPAQGFHGRWPQACLPCCCSCCCHCPGPRPALPAAPTRVAATAQLWNVAPCGCALCHTASQQGRRWVLRGARAAVAPRPVEGGAGDRMGTRTGHNGHPPSLPPQTLFLQDNSIEHLGPGVLAPLAALRHLYLHNNSLTALEPGAFRTQPRLLELALTGNRLQGLRTGAFSGLSQLRILYLAGNQLVQLLDFTFLHLPVRRGVPDVP